MGCRAWKLEVDLLDDAELLVGDHESQHHDHADQDEEGEQHAGQVADDPDTVSTQSVLSQYHYSIITVPSQSHHSIITRLSQSRRGPSLY